MSALVGYLPILIQASLLTFGLAICSLGFATFMGAIGAWGKLSSSPIGYENANAYTWIVRGIPDIVLLILVYYGVQGGLNALTGAIGLEHVSISVFWSGVIALGFIYGAYLTETFRGAYLAVPRGQSEAAAALGLHRLVVFGKVLAPQVFRHALSGYGNVFQVLIKSTAVLSVIGFNDLVGLATDAGRSVREPFLFLSFVLVIYLLFYYLVGVVFDFLEKHLEIIER